MIFDHPKWKLEHAPELADVGLVSNRMQVMHNKRVTNTAIVLPPEAFLLIEHLLKDCYRSAYFYLDQTSGEHHIFGLAYVSQADGLENNYDLWRIANKAIPDWMLRDEYLVR